MSSPVSPATPAPTHDVHGGHAGEASGACVCWMRCLRISLAHPHLRFYMGAVASRVERWKEKRGVDDPDLFAERIPYAETRDYVRIIQRTAEFYRSLYAWGQEPLSLAPRPGGR